MTLTHTVRSQGGVATLRLEGRIDRDALGSLDAAYAEAAAGAPSVVELDFRGVDYINSTGIALIVGLLGKARSQSQAVRAVGLSEHYRHIFEITRLSDFIEIVQPV
jgi:anti-sigma B factor antagonist